MSDYYSKLDAIHKDINQVILKAGKIILDYRPNVLKGIGVGEKVDKSKLTVMDGDIQELYDTELPEIIKRHLGAYRVTIIGEESKKKANIIREALFADYLYIVDSLDGTWPYTVSGNMEYGTGIGLFKRDGTVFVPISGFFYMPEFNVIGKDSLFEARESLPGAYLNGKEIKVSDSLDLSDKKATLQRSSRGDLPFLNKLQEAFGKPQLLLAGSMAGHAKDSTECAAGLGRIVQVAASGTYPELNYLHTQRRPAIWDVYSGSTYIVSKAGGVVIHPDGKSVFPFDLSQKINGDTFDYTVDSILAFPEIAFDKIMEIIK